MVTVTVGSVEHPMLPEHSIEWVFLQTKHGNQKKVLCPGDKPVVYFSICDGDEVEAVYAYCNLLSFQKAQGRNENKIYRKKEFTQQQVQEMFLSVGWVSGQYPSGLHKALMNSSKLLAHGMMTNQLDLFVYWMIANLWLICIMFQLIRHTMGKGLLEL